MHGSLITESKNSEVHTLAMIRKDTKTDEDSNFFYTLFTPQRFTQIYNGFQEIEKSYYLATELLPGIGVAFNHLGIISQQKEQQFYRSIITLGNYLHLQSPRLVSEQLVPFVYRK
jgi:hypothetical protein